MEISVTASLRDRLNNERKCDRARSTHNSDVCWGVTRVVVLLVSLLTAAEVPRHHGFGLIPKAQALLLGCCLSLQILVFGGSTIV